MTDDPNHAADRFRQAPSSLIKPTPPARGRALEWLIGLAVAALVLAFAGCLVLMGQVEHQVLSGQPELCASKVPLEIKGRIFQVCAATANQSHWAQRGFLALWAIVSLGFCLSYLAQQRSRRR